MQIPRFARNDRAGRFFHAFLRQGPENAAAAAAYFQEVLAPARRHAGARLAPPFAFRLPPAGVRLAAKWVVFGA